MKMVLQWQMHGLLGIYVFSESHSFAEQSIEDDYHCTEHIVQTGMKEQCGLSTSSCTSLQDILLSIGSQCSWLSRGSDGDR